MSAFIGKFGEVRYKISLTLDDFDEIIDSLNYAAEKDPECDVEYNRTLRSKMTKKRREARKFEREQGEA